MKQLIKWKLLERKSNGVSLLIEDRHLLEVYALDSNLFRVSLQRDGKWRLNRSWTISPEQNTPVQGRDRHSHEGFVCPSVTVSESDPLVISTDLLRVIVNHPLRLTWEVLINGNWLEFAKDRETGAMFIGRKDHRVEHYMASLNGERTYGLGEKAGPLERHGRRFEMRNLDALGYSARHTDPLYKHIPYYMVQTPNAGCWSIFYDNLSSCWFDLHQERDNYHTPYRAWRAEDGDLDYYLRWEPQLLDLTRAQNQLTGGSCFPPRWSLGYLASTMSYTDADNAQEQLLTFLDQIRENDIPCDGFHLSSGYSSINGKRYVFNWNRDKFPDPENAFAKFARDDIHLIANIKPCLLHDHPRYDEAADKALFVKDSETGEPEQSAFWDDWGSHLDFSNPQTIDWWQQGVTRQLLKVGIDSTWNDNNEYEIWDRQARCDGFGDPIEISLIRPLHSQWMCRASSEAQRRHKPGKRPYLITRSGAPGLQRFSQTWSGDNYTSWETLRWNIRMGLGLSQSGIYNLGHDVGGFSGPRPDPELFIRWVQNGIFHPRFSIHSWNDDDSANEPWMYPQVIDLVRDAIKFRYRILPYLYTCLWRSVAHHEPILRPTFLDHPDDQQCYEDCDEFMLGTDLLVATVVEPQQSLRTIYLPDNQHGWWDFFNQRWYAGGQTLEYSVNIDTMPLFVRAGAVIPMGHDCNRANVEAETGRKLLVFPYLRDGKSYSWLYEDDGASDDSPYSLLRLEVARSGSEITLNTKQLGNTTPTFSKAQIVLVGDDNELLANGLIYQNGDELALPEMH